MRITVTHDGRGICRCAAGSMAAAIPAAMAAALLLASGVGARGTDSERVGARDTATGTTTGVAAHTIHLPKVLRVPAPGAGLRLATTRWGYVHTAAVAGDVGVVNEGTHFTVLDVSDPEQPLPIARLGPYWSGPTSVEIRPSVLYLCVDGLHVFDLAEPSRPAEIGQVGVPCDAGVFGPDTFYSWDRSNIYVTDLSDPAGARLVAKSHYMTDGPMEYRPRVSVRSGTAVYVLTEFGTYAFDVSIPSAPRDLGKVRSNVRLESAIGHIGYAHDDAVEEGMVIVDLSDPLEPMRLGVLDVCARGTRAFRVQLGGSLGYVDCRTSVGDRTLGSYWQLVDVTRPNAPVPLGSIGYAEVEARANSRQLRWVGQDLATMATGRQARLIDHRDRLHPKAAGRIDPLITEASHLADDGRHLFVADNTRRQLWTVDLTDPAEPVPVHDVGFERDIRDLETHDGYSFAVGYLDRGPGQTVGGYLTMYEVAPDGRTDAIGHHEMPSLAYAVVVEGDYAYVAEFDGLRIVRVVPGQPMVDVGRAGREDGIGVLLNVVGGPDGIVYGIGSQLQVIDASDVTAPIGVQSVPTGRIYPSGEAHVHRGVLFVSTQDEGVLAYDISSPKEPRLMRRLGVAGGRMTSNGDDLIVANVYGISRVRVLEGGELMGVDRLPLALPSPTGLAALNNHVFVAMGGSSGIAVVDAAAHGHGP